MFTNLIKKLMYVIQTHTLPTNDSNCQQSAYFMQACSADPFLVTEFNHKFLCFFEFFSYCQCLVCPVMEWKPRRCSLHTKAKLAFTIQEYNCHLNKAYQVIPD